MSALPPDWDLRPPAHWWGAASSQTSDDGGADDFGDTADEALLGPLGAPDVRAGVIVPIDDLLPQRLAAILAWWRRSQDATAKLPPELTQQRRHRLVLGLRVLDGITDGASHREIARGLFGPSRVPAGPAWKSHHLRSRIVRLIHDAKALRDYGYRNLLRSGLTVRF